MEKSQYDLKWKKVYNGYNGSLGDPFLQVRHCREAVDDRRGGKVVWGWAVIDDADPRML